MIKMDGSEAWRTILEGQGVAKDELALGSLLDCAGEGLQAEEQSGLETPMETSKLREATSIANYFIISSLPGFLNTYLELSKILPGGSSRSHAKLTQLQVKLGAEDGAEAEKLKTSRAKLYLCFSRRWREPQLTIYLLAQDFITSQKRSRVRVQMVNQRGLILQTISNMDPATYLTQLSKILASHYSRLQAVFLVDYTSSAPNLDQIDVLRQGRGSLQVGVVCLGGRGGAARVGELGGAGCWVGRREAQGGVVVVASANRELSMVFTSGFGGKTVSRCLGHLEQIIERESFLASLFAPFDYQTDNFNQKQLLLRLFAFYFNFITLEGMQAKNPSQLEERASVAVCEQLERKKQEMESRMVVQQAHTFSSNPTSLRCPVCNRKSRISCRRCCLELNRSFSLCQHNCFEVFHRDKVLFANTLQKYKPYQTFQLAPSTAGLANMDQNPGAHPSESQQVAEAEHLPLLQATSMAEIRAKWGRRLQNCARNLQEFQVSCQVGFLSQNIYLKMKYLREVINRPPPEQPARAEVKKQEC